VAFDAIEPEDRTLELVRRADCLCFGTLIQRAPVSRKTLEVLLDAFKGRFTLLDINLRRSCYTPETIRFSLGKANILKMNEDEAPEMAGLYCLPAGGLDAIASGLVEKADLDYCLITLGARGVFAASRTGEKHYLPTYAVSPLDSCGSGDAFTAGFIHALLSGQSLEDCCRFGNALGALVSGQQGATQPVTGAQIQALLAEGIPEDIEGRLEAFRREVRAGR
jgi:fructokinase